MGRTVETLGVFNQRYGHPSGHVHRQIKGDHIRRPNCGFIQLVDGQIQRMNLSPGLPQPGGGRSQAKGLAAQFVG